MAKDSLIRGFEMLNPVEAERELGLAAQLNPGPWEQHSRAVAENARRIAERAKGMDSAQAYVMGLLHDIGRRAGVKGIMHIFGGYVYMMDIGQEEIARICLTHSFPAQWGMHYGKASGRCGTKAWLAGMYD